MRSKEIVAKAREFKAGFGVKCSKFAGAISVEILRASLADEAIATSCRDVFIRGIPVEIDLLVPRPGEVPSLALLYEPGQVAAALEVKNSGSFGDATLEKLRKDFGRFERAGIPCAYVTLEERQGYRWAASSERIGFPCFTLAWHKAAGGAFQVTADWNQLVEFLRECLSARRASRAEGPPAKAVD